MELSGKIIIVNEPQSGTSQRTGQPWVSQDYVLETFDTYPKKCYFRIFGEDRIRSAAIELGKEVTISFDIDAREFNGRWYNDIRVWRVQQGVIPAQPAAAPIQPTAGATAAGVAAPAYTTPEPAPIPAPTAQAMPAAPAQPAPAATGNMEEDLPF